MKSNALSIAATLLLAAGIAGHTAPAHAGDLTNGVLNCYVDTNALEVPKPTNCRSSWTPWTASDPTIAVFEVAGLTAGSYSYVWIDLETGGSPGCSGSQCVVPIATDVSGDGLRHLSVTITDLGTGLQKTVTARARYFDAYH